MEDFSDLQIERYARHLVLPELGEEGQARLLDSGVLVIGAGGLGSPLLLYLASAGVGRLGIVDHDEVDLSNLQRQVIHGTGDVERAKVDSAADAIRRVNPDVKVVRHRERITRANAADLVANYDLVADGSDNFATRYLVHDACYFARVPLVSAAIMRFDGQLSTFKAYRPGDGHPCYRCIFGPQPPDPKESCADVGVLATLPGVMGTLQASEVIKELAGIGESLSGRLVLFDALAATFRKVSVKRDPDCQLCGRQATIRDLQSVDYGEDEPFCAA